MTAASHPPAPPSRDVSRTAPLRLGVCLRTTPRAVWALAGLFATLMTAYSVLVPTYHGPDETKHVDMLFAAREPGGWPAERERLMNEQVVESSRAAGYAPGREARSADEAVPRAQRPTLEDLAADAPSPVTSQMWQHPPLAYVVTAVGLGIVTAVVPAAGGWAHDQVVGMARLLTALLLVPVPLLAYWTARRFAGGRTAVTAAVLAVAVPGVTHVGATVTNDALLITLVGLVTLALAYIATGDLSLRTGLLAGLAAGLALLTKGFALFLPAWIAAAYVLAAWRQGPASLRPAAGAGALSVGVASAVGGWWWLRNVLDLGVVQPQGFSLAPPGPGFSPDVGRWLATLLSVVPRTFWGHFGWVEAPLPWAAVALATVVVTAGLFLAVRRRHPPPPWERADVALLLGGMAGTAAIMLYGSWEAYVDTGRQAAMHGRYLMPGLVGLAVAAGLGLTAGLPRRWARVAPLGLLAAAGALHVLAAAVMITRFWRAPGTSYTDGLTAMVAWSPWPPVFAVAAAVLAAATFAWSATELALCARRPPGLSPAGPTRSSRAEAWRRRLPRRPYSRTG